MNVNFYERLWMWAAGVIIAAFIAVIGVSAVAYGLHPPSHVETIDPAKVFTDPRFSRLGEPVVQPDGVIEVQIAAPQRVRMLVLLSPGGLLPMVRQFSMRGVLMVALPTRLTVKSFFR